MRKYLQSYYNLPRRNDPAGGTSVMLLGWGAGSTPRSGTSAPVFEVPIPGGLMIPGAQLECDFINSRGGATGGAVIRALGRNNTAVTLYSAADDSVARLFQITICVLGFDASTNNVITFGQRADATTVIQTPSTVSVPFISDSWLLQFLPGTTDTQTVPWYQVTAISPAYFPSAAPGNRLTQ